MNSTICYILEIEKVENKPGKIDSVRLQLGFFFRVEVFQNGDFIFKNSNFLLKKLQDDFWREQKPKRDYHDGAADNLIQWRFDAQKQDYSLEV